LWPFSTERGPTRKRRTGILAGLCCDRTRGNCFKLKEGRFTLDVRRKFFYSECGGTLERVAQRCGRCPIPGNILFCDFLTHIEVTGYEHKGKIKILDSWERELVVELF